jgi:hypothetical protein
MLITEEGIAENIRQITFLTYRILFEKLLSKYFRKNRG